MLARTALHCRRFFTRLTPRLPDSLGGRVTAWAFVLAAALLWSLALVACALQPEQAARNTLFASAGLLTFVAFFLSRWAARRLLAPLEKVRRAMQGVARGELPLAPLPANGKDEIATLTGIFNELVENHHRSNAALANSEGRFRSLVENAPHAIFVHVGERFAYVNTATLELFGARSKSSLLGKPVIDCVHPSMHGVVEARVRLVENARHNAAALEHKLLRLDGTVVYADVSAIPFDYGNEKGGLVFARDMTERKLAEEALRESEERFHHLVALSSEWYWEQDEHYRFTHFEGWDPHAAARVLHRLLGRTRWESAYHAEMDEARWNEHRATLQARLPFTDFEYMVRDDDGQFHWFSINGEPLFSTAGVFKGYRGTGKDITERKLAEEELRRSWERIRQLAVHQEVVKEEERKRIARDIHDELGQTLLAMRLDAQMLSGELDASDPLLREKSTLILSHIDTAMKSVKAIINDLRPSVLDLGLLAAIEWQIREFQRRSNIVCTLDVDDEGFDRYLDEHSAAALFRIVQESMANVLRHARASRIDLAISTDGDRLAVVIADDGIGMIAETGGKSESFGLIGIEERIRALGGTFRLASLPGQGTTLSLSVPISVMPLNRMPAIRD